MTENELKDKINQNLVEIDKGIGKYEDRHAIEMLMAQYILNDNPSNQKMNISLFALNQPDVSIEWNDMGIFRGAEKVRKFIEEQGLRRVYQGEYLSRWLATQIIEISEDGKSAEAAWLAPGAEAFTESNGKVNSLWNFVRFAVDFIKEEKEWKIWHLCMFQDVRCEYEKGWGIDNYKWVYKGKQPDAENEDSTWVNPYNTGYIQEPIPSIPMPYETYKDNSWIFSNEPTYGKKRS